MKNKKFSIWLNIVTICLSICAIAIGVYSAKTASLSINGSIGFTAANCRVRVLGTVTGANETVSPYQEESNVGKVVSDTATPWNVAVTFDTSNLEDGEIAKPIKIAFKMNNLSVSYGVFAQFDFSEEMQSNLNIDIDFTSSLSGYEVLYSADRLCVLDKNYATDVTATVTLTPKSNESNFTLNLENSFSVNFCKQPTATETSTSGEYEYGNLIYAVDSYKEGYATAKVKDNSVTGDIIVPPQIVIDGTTYKVDLYVSDDPNPNYSDFCGTAEIETLSLPSTFSNTGHGVLSSSKIKGVLIPKSSTGLDSMFLYNCINLTNVKIHSKFTYIFYETFENTPFLTNLQANSDGIYICSDGKKIVIKAPTSIKSVNLAGVYLIGDSAFHSCTNLTSVTIPSSLTILSHAAFYGCTGLTSVTFAENCQLTSITPETFIDCTNLTSITIPSSVVSIGIDAFYGCTGLTSITIPSSVTNIGTNAFVGCGLVNISVDSGNKVYDSRNSCNAIIETATNTLISGCKNTVIPNVTSIGQAAFGNCTGLTSITIPSSVTSIGRLVFAGCNNLTSVTFATTSGWTANGTSLTLTNASTNATYLTGQYTYCEWKRT